MRQGFSFYKYVSVKDALLIMNDGTLYFTNPLNFNDPYDIAPSFPKEGRSKCYKFLLNHHGVRPKVHGKQKTEDLKRLDDEQLRADLLQKWSVTCFSKSPFILPLWAHYADNHTGCVLEFRVTPQINDYIEMNLNKNHMDDELLYPLSVIYSKNRPRAYDADGLVTNEIALSMILTKDEAWAYEQEMRSFKTRKQGAYSFRKDQLHRIYCGIKMEKTDIEKINRAVNAYRKAHSHLIKVDKVHLDRHEFKMTKL